MNEGSLPPSSAVLTMLSPLVQKGRERDSCFRPPLVGGPRNANSYHFCAEALVKREKPREGETLKAIRKGSRPAGVQREAGSWGRKAGCIGK